MKVSFLVVDLGRVFMVYSVIIVEVTYYLFVF